jgi:hypothetical protein
MFSMFTVTGQVMRTYIQPGAVDKNTGEIGQPTPKVQIMGEIPVRGGGAARLDLITLTPENMKTYADLQGKRIRVALGFFSPAKGEIVYYIPKGAEPELCA